MAACSGAATSLALGGDTTSTGSLVSLTLKYCSAKLLELNNNSSVPFPFKIKAALS